MAERQGAVPFSRPVEVVSVGEEGSEVAIRATEAERAALAALYGIVAIDDLAAAFALKREPRSGLWVRGTVDAAIHQTCVLTLEPFPSQVSEPVDVHFLPEEDVAAFEARMRLASAAEGADLSEANVPDAIAGGMVDLGALAAEFLALGLDPYPRKPGASFVEPTPAGSERPDSPFAALLKLKNRSPDESEGEAG